MSEGGFYIPPTHKNTRVEKKNSQSLNYVFFSVPQKPFSATCICVYIKEAESIVNIR